MQPLFVLFIIYLNVVVVSVIILNIISTLKLVRKLNKNIFFAVGASLFTFWAYWTYLLIEEKLKELEEEKRLKELRAE
jgi:hypothetical protein